MKPTEKATEYVKFSDALLRARKQLDLMRIPRKDTSDIWLRAILKERVTEPDNRPDGSLWWPLKYFACAELTKPYEGYEPGKGFHGSKCGRLGYTVADIKPAIEHIVRNRLHEKRNLKTTLIPEADAATYQPERE